MANNVDLLIATCAWYQNNDLLVYANNMRIFSKSQFPFDICIFSGISNQLRLYNSPIKSLSLWKSGSTTRSAFDPLTPPASRAHRCYRTRLLSAFYGAFHSFPRCYAMNPPRLKRFLMLL